MDKLIILSVLLLGILFIIASLLYFALPAESLPSFFPGYQVGLLKHHYKHGTGSIILGLGCFAFVWFQTGKKSTQ